jgi:hypothetical protein
MATPKRRNSYIGTVDPSSIATNTYNDAVGAQKNMEAGHHLLPIPAGGAFTCDATTARAIEKGKTLAIYNTTSTLYSATLGDSAAMASLAPGATDASGNVGIPCIGNNWTYIANYDRQFVRTSNAALLVFIVKDESNVILE